MRLDFHGDASDLLSESVGLVLDEDAAKAQIEAKTRQLGEVAARVRELDEQLR